MSSGNDKSHASCPIPDALTTLEQAPGSSVTITASRRSAANRQQRDHQAWAKTPCAQVNSQGARRSLVKHPRERNRPLMLGRWLFCAPERGLV
jgi:hypothetical protein